MASSGAAPAALVATTLTVYFPDLFSRLALMVSDGVVALSAFLEPLVTTTE
jgi:hypothetical protein